MKPRSQLALFAVSLLLLCAGACITLERGVAFFVYRESLSDVRFHAYPYVGRRCDELIVAPDVTDAKLRIENVGSVPLLDLRITVKAFAHSGLGVAEHTLERLEPGEMRVFDADDLALDALDSEDLGMVYARVRCDAGVAVGRDWSSSWN